MLLIVPVSWVQPCAIPQTQLRTRRGYPDKRGGRGLGSTWVHVGVRVQLWFELV